MTLSNWLHRNFRRHPQKKRTERGVGRLRGRRSLNFRIRAGLAGEHLEERAVLSHLLTVNEPASGFRDAFLPTQSAAVNGNMSGNEIDSLTMFFNEGDVVEFSIAAVPLRADLQSAVSYSQSVYAEIFDLQEWDSVTDPPTGELLQDSGSEVSSMISTGISLISGGGNIALSLQGEATIASSGVAGNFFITGSAEKSITTGTHHPDRGYANVDLGGTNQFSFHLAGSSNYSGTWEWSTNRDGVSRSGTARSLIEMTPVLPVGQTLALDKLPGCPSSTESACSQSQTEFATAEWEFTPDLIEPMLGIFDPSGQLYTMTKDNLQLTVPEAGHWRFVVARDNSFNTPTPEPNLGYRRPYSLDIEVLPDIILHDVTWVEDGLELEYQVIRSLHEDTTINFGWTRDKADQGGAGFAIYHIPVSKIPFRGTVVVPKENLPPWGHGLEDFKWLNIQADPDDKVEETNEGFSVGDNNKLEIELPSSVIPPQFRFELPTTATKNESYAWVAHIENQNPFRQIVFIEWDWNSPSPVPQIHDKMGTQTLTITDQEKLQIGEPTISWPWIPAENPEKTVGTRMFEVDLMGFIARFGRVGSLTADLAAALDEAFRLLETSQMVTSQITTAHTLRYEYGGPSNPILHSVEVNVPEESKFHLARWYLTVTKALNLIGDAKAWDAGNPGPTVVTPAADYIAQKILDIADAYYEQAKDPPDGNFTVIPRISPEYEFREEYSSFEHQIENSSERMRAWVDAEALARDRAIGAQLENEPRWQAEQRIAAARFGLEGAIESIHSILNYGHLKPFIDTTIRPNSEAIVESLTVDGLPTELASRLSENGWTEQQLDALLFHSTSIGAELWSNESVLANTDAASMLFTFGAILFDVNRAIDVRVEQLGLQNRTPNRDELVAVQSKLSSIEAKLQNGRASLEIIDEVRDVSHEIIGLAVAANNKSFLESHLDQALNYLLQFADRESHDSATQLVENLLASGDINDAVGAQLLADLDDIEHEIAVAQFDSALDRLNSILLDVNSMRGMEISEDAADRISSRIDTLKATFDAASLTIEEVLLNDAIGNVATSIDKLSLRFSHAVNLDAKIEEKTISEAIRIVGPSDQEITIADVMYDTSSFQLDIDLRDAELPDGIYEMIINTNMVVPIHYDGQLTDDDGINDGEIRIVFHQRNFDFGDAPDSMYSSLLSEDGPRHAVGGPWLGESVAGELNARPRTLATGDTSDDGIRFPELLIAGQTSFIEVTSSNASSHLDIFVDFDGVDGFANNPNEHLRIALTGGTELIPITIPEDAVAGRTFARFRISTSGGLGPTGFAPDGEVEDYPIVILNPPFGFYDFEDFDTVEAPGLPSGWEANEDVRGNVWRVKNEINESDSGTNHAVVRNSNVLTDSRLVSPVIPSETGTTRISFRHDYFTLAKWDGGLFEISIAGGPFLDILEAGGSFEAGGYNEQIFEQVETPIESRFAWSGLSRGYVDTMIRLPESAVGSDVQFQWRYVSYEHFGAVRGWRVDSIMLEGPGGELPMDFGDAPRSFGTTLDANGARHVVGEVFLGHAIDAEPNGQPHEEAAGDDATNASDDDGIFFDGPLIPGAPNTFTIIASSNSVLSGWIDFNGDGDWNDEGEQVLDDVAVPAGESRLRVVIPAAAALHESVFARFRIGSMLRLRPTGPAPDGEVEDMKMDVERIVVPGDSNFDGRFDSSDLVRVFQAGKYEDGIPNNTSFTEGDWNGDGDFTTADLVFAFQAGTYEATNFSRLAWAVRVDLSDDHRGNNERIQV